MLHIQYSYLPFYVKLKGKIFLYIFKISKLDELGPTQVALAEFGLGPHAQIQLTTAFLYEAVVRPL